MLIDEEIEDCKPFIERIKKFQRTNLKFLHTNKQKSVAYNNLNRTEEFPDQVPESKRYAGKQHGHRSGGFRGNNDPHGDGARGSFHGQRPQPRCHLCEEPHVTFR